MSDPRKRVLLVAEASNPELTSVALIGYSLARALAEVAEVHLVTELRNRESLLAAGMAAADFTAIDNRAAQGAAFRIAKVIRGGNSLGWTIYSALSNFAYPLFEKKVWRHFRGDLESGKYDLVHRITPLSPTTPSPLVRHLRRAGVPLVIGPLNGGVPWPEGFQHLRRSEREWLSYVRGMYKLTPGIGRTRRDAAALIMASKHTYGEVTDGDSGLEAKSFYIPENAIDPERFPDAGKSGPREGPLEVAFVGRLVPYKGADVLIEAAAPLVREGKLKVRIFGDGDQMPELKNQVKAEGIESGVDLVGWLKHTELGRELGQCDIFGFPSVREFGGGVVIEAMALGLCPIVADYAGPAELVPDACGYRIPLDNRETLVASLRSRLEELAADPKMTFEKGEASRRYVREHLTWPAKAAQISKIYDWVSCGEKARPELPFEL